MNKTIISVIVAVIILGGAAFWLTSNKDDADDSGTSQTEDQQTQQSDSAGSPQTLRQLLAGGSQRCSFSDPEPASESQGTVYVAGGKMRGDFQAGSDDGQINSHMIIKDETVYTWSDSINTGFKISLAAMESDSDAPSDAIDPDKEIDFDCSSWSADDSLFNLPDIEFSDMSSFGAGADLQLNSDTDTSGRSNQSVCDQVPEEVRADCLEALN